ncbi:hypothetical protein GLAREA_01922 [Glarea lozoyensis ATCC 20868]|uniref:Uncharacterized protein n=1 Tax=Glarea lozoyensis (strain ATCC 20868 / MF5171) TaxID=1116229 RepID=S3CJN1_GLAL2|nr:uncharacterized protein GLAREA_01922 [Glarea lozoyensis ATCC 20868]EPE26010.1 hypothetical protein GLAREA_01922 [Glarea lozoyensis ATCC 20868]
MAGSRKSVESAVTAWLDSQDSWYTVPEGLVATRASSMTMGTCYTAPEGLAATRTSSMNLTPPSMTTDSRPRSSKNIPVVAMNSSLYTRANGSSFTLPVLRLRTDVGPVRPVQSLSGASLPTMTVPPSAEAFHLPYPPVSTQLGTLPMLVSSSSEPSWAQRPVHPLSRKTLPIGPSPLSQVHTPAEPLQRRPKKKSFKRQVTGLFEPKILPIFKTKPGLSPTKKVAKVGKRALKYVWTHVVRTFTLGWDKGDDNYSVRSW